MLPIGAGESNFPSLGPQTVLPCTTPASIRSVNGASVHRFCLLSSMNRTLSPTFRFRGMRLSQWCQEGMGFELLRSFACRDLYGIGQLPCQSLNQLRVSPLDHHANNRFGAGRPQ